MVNRALTYVTFQISLPIALAKVLKSQLRISAP